MDYAVVDTAAYELVLETLAKQCSNRDGSDNGFLTEHWNCSIDLAELQYDGSSDKCLQHNKLMRLTCYMATYTTQAIS